MFSDSGRRYPLIVPALLLALAWYAVIHILWGDWKIDPQYGYGMLVPLLMLGLLFRRIADRPVPETPGPAQKAAASLVLLAACLLLAFMVPIAEANPDWRPVGLAVSLLSVILSLATISLLGGMPWLRHFAFPVCFFLIAVPWPRNFEQSVMGELMSWNASATLEILHWLGFEASRQGNLIVIPSGVLGVEEACSGVRSLQSGMMVSLFLGEMLRLVPWRRSLLVLVALAAALAGNVIRTSLLAVVACRQGMSSLSVWHDPAGLIVLLITFGTVAYFALKWKSSLPPPIFRGGNPPAVSRARVSLALFVPALFILILAIAGTEAWYRLHESNEPEVTQWSLHPSGSEGGASRVAISQQTLKMLFYPEGFSERWSVGDHSVAQSFYFRWPAGRTSLQASAMHRPEVCLASIGMKVVSPLSPRVHVSRGVTIPFRAWLFEQKGIRVHVFQALVEEGSVHATSSRELDESAAGRLRAVIEGRRNKGRRMIEVAFWNLPDEESAGSALDLYLNRTLR